MNGKMTCDPDYRDMNGEHFLRQLQYFSHLTYNKISLASLSFHLIKLRNLHVAPAQELTTSVMAFNLLIVVECGNIAIFHCWLR